VREQVIEVIEIIEIIKPPLREKEIFFGAEFFFRIFSPKTIANVGIIIEF